MKCKYCERELDETEYRFCFICFQVLRRKYSVETVKMSSLDFEDWLNEKIETQIKADTLFDKRNIE